MTAGFLAGAAAACSAASTEADAAIGSSAAGSADTEPVDTEPVNAGLGDAGRVATKPTPTTAATPRDTPAVTLGCSLGTAASDGAPWNVPRGWTLCLTRTGTLWQQYGKDLATTGSNFPTSRPEADAMTLRAARRQAR